MVADSLTTIRLDQPTPSTGVAGEASLTAARNEAESFQVIVEAGAEMSDVVVAKGKPLTGPGGRAIPARNIVIYREVPYEVGSEGKPPSDSEGGPGLWPDALIPARDYFYGERRRAFPVDIPSGGKAVAWVDVLVPPRQQPGTYRGSVVVRESTGLLAEVPVTLSVRGFRIPSTTSLRSSFGVEERKVCKAHTGDAGCRESAKRRWQLYSLYVRAGLENRVTLSNPVPTGADEPPDSAAERRLFERYVEPAVQGTSRTRLRGAKLTSMSISWGCLDEGRSCLVGWRELARRYGFGSRLSLYLCDEPAEDPDLWRECQARAARAHRSWSGIRKLVTATLQQAHQTGFESFLSQIDILVPVVNEVAGMAGTDVAGNQRPGYDAYLRGAGRRSLWLYTSCQSYGCGDTPIGSPSEVGWPGYAIDQPASQARAMGWLTFLYRASGELYYQTTSQLPSAWSHQFQEGGNGDGTMFYPGTPRGAGGGPPIGGRHGIPIESIRMKRIRDGREDYEYLRILAKRGLRSEAQATAEGLFGDPSVAMHRATVTPQALAEARDKLAKLIAPEAG